MQCRQHRGSLAPHPAPRHPREAQSCACALSAQVAETQSSATVKSSTSSRACVETRGLKPGWGRCVTLGPLFLALLK